MENTRKKTFLILAIIGAIYFALCFIPNASTLGSNNPIVFLDRDEYVTYPIVERMLAFDGDIHRIWGSLIIYGDYHYGYPFYFISMLVLLPLRLVQGGDFFNHVAFNILLLRQFINVLPMVATAGVLTYTQTHFRSLWKSLLIFLLLLTIPAVVRSNLHWWHPDALMLLAIALTFLFLDLDEFRLGRYFYLAAAACGLASAIKLMGFFFFLAIPVYLLIAWRKKKYSIGKLARSALLFLAVMIAVIVLSNPFLFYKSPRDEMLAIQSFKSQELTSGYEHEDSLYYSKGPQYWRWTLKVSYGKIRSIYIFAAALILGCFYGPRKEANWLRAAWSAPLAVYLLWFVSPKPDHYLLPLLVPIFSTITNLTYPLEKMRMAVKKWKQVLGTVGWLLFAIFLFMQFNDQITKSVVLFSKYLGS
jgi:4-amino-4-deoxy-L-arabinose transferase-like glycosyltransferase